MYVYPADCVTIFFIITFVNLYYSNLCPAIQLFHYLMKNYS